MSKFVGFGPVSRKEYTSHKLYVEEWYSIIKPLEKKLGVRTIGFDPGILVCDKTGEGRSIDIPVWLAIRIIHASE